ncbi:AzlD domain-containing protein (plasmid) [Pseudorhodobacter turbinis]|uniref:AzlD domain-containing protein n=1 Tax=Pseudorhodobacter turbinis TaxID=2500533 RepID=A0A4P8EHN7_9RHOB|nr:AzlD domain-containing protein [Pseudorhodobacter turbinis]QCO56680.1 AzlD domain-containing protein [Pseudorhodobacter turbinis]
MLELSDFTIVIAGLAAANLAIRLGGYYLGAALPQSGAWARGLQALPGTLITALVTLQLLNGGPAEWVAGGVALLVAIATRSLPVTMIVGIVAIYVLRQMAWGG